jgi:hypothetical protein
VVVGTMMGTARAGMVWVGVDKHTRQRGLSRLTGKHTILQAAVLLKSDVGEGKEERSGAETS